MRRLWISANLSLFGLVIPGSTAGCAFSYVPCHAVGIAPLLFIDKCICDVISMCREISWNTLAVLCKLKKIGVLNLLLNVGNRFMLHFQLAGCAAGTICTLQFTRTRMAALVFSIQ